MRRELSSHGAFIGYWEINGLSEGEDAQLSAAKGAGESAALLHAIFPKYPDLWGTNSAPEVGAFLLDLRSQSSPDGEENEPSSATDDSRIPNPHRPAAGRRIPN